MRIKGRHILCWIGIHNWGFRTQVNYGIVDDYHWCKREGCFYYHEILVNREESPILKDRGE